jgi:hypothetical protein
MLNTVKLYHWKTSSYSTHKATDELYSNLNEKIDSFVEILLGTTSRSIVLHPISLRTPLFSNNDDFKRQVEKYKGFLLGITGGSDLLNIRDEILGLLNQFLYLLTLH